VSSSPTAIRPRRTKSSTNDLAAWSAAGDWLSPVSGGAAGHAEPTRLRCGAYEQVARTPRLRWPVGGIVAEHS
jgi:hypothetical protein